MKIYNSTMIESLVKYFEQNNLLAGDDWEGTISQDETLLEITAIEAAGTLLDIAKDLKKCHTLSGQWDDEEAASQAEYCYLVGLAKRLISNNERLRPGDRHA